MKAACLETKRAANYFLDFFTFFGDFPAKVRRMALTSYERKRSFKKILRSQSAGANFGNEGQKDGILEFKPQSLTELYPWLNPVLTGDALLTLLDSLQEQSNVLTSPDQKPCR